MGPTSCAFGIDETVIRIGVWWTRRNFWWRHSIKMADHETVFMSALASARRRSYIHTLSVAPGRCVFFERKHPAPASGISFAGTWVSRQEPATIAGSGVDLHTGYSPSQPVGSGEDAVPCQAIKAISTGLGTNLGGAVSGCLYIGTTTSEISWEVISADGSWRQSTKLTPELRDSMTELQHMRSALCQHHGLITVRWRYLTFCQLRFGGRQESSRIPIYETWLVSLMGCLCWVQWWSHKSWIQDIFSHLHSLHDLYAATAITFLMKITWLLGGIFMYGTEAGMWVNFDCFEISPGIGWWAECMQPPLLRSIHEDTS